jgi:hypothetical protein
LVGRFDVSQGDPEGDLKAMSRLRALLKPDAVMLLTIPCGRDSVVAPFHRVYGVQRLPHLLTGYKIDNQSFWAKDIDNRWGECKREEALAYQPTAHPRDPGLCSYALACFVLRKPEA